MSHSSSLFNRVPVDLPNRSGFNLDHENFFTATCGTLIPAYAKPVLPGEKFSMGVNFQCQLPPMVTDFYGKIDAVFEAFFVPNRILWGGWESFITHPTSRPVYPEGTNVRARPTLKPTIVFNGAAGFTALETPGGLPDYLGLKLAPDAYVEGATFRCDALPFLAYHMIYDKWYRDTRIQAPCFYPPATTDSAAFAPATAPYVSIVASTNTEGQTYGYTNILGDGVALYKLRQRNWSKGYFTSASPYPQAGEEEKVQIPVDGETGTLSIAALRTANSIQRWKERNNFSYEYGDQIYLNYGVYPSSAKMEKPIYLGRVKQVVYSRSVMQTAGGDGTLNNVVAAKKASSQAIGEGTLFTDFTPTEHGFLFVIYSLVPHAYYSTGCARHMFELESEDIPFPLLAGAGDQPVYLAEISGAQEDMSSGLLDDTPIFGWTDRYAHYKYDEDEVHGYLRDGQNLDAFALQRSFGSDAQLSSSFLQIPINALDQVQAVKTSESGFSCWVDCFFKCSKISPLPAYSVPTLGDLKNTHKGYASKGGSRL